jgi:hypothetical protein
MRCILSPSDPASVRPLNARGVSGCCGCLRPLRRACVIWGRRLGRFAADENGYGFRPHRGRRPIMRLRAFVVVAGNHPHPMQTTLLETGQKGSPVNLALIEKLTPRKLRFPSSREAAATRWNCPSKSTAATCPKLLPAPNAPFFGNEIDGGLLGGFCLNLDCPKQSCVTKPPVENRAQPF